MSQTKPYPLPITGVDVLSSETALMKGAVRAAVNVDIGRAGRFKRRAGYVRRSVAAGLHSLYQASQKGWTLIGKDSTLNRLDTTTYGLTLLHNLQSPDPVSYVEYNGNVYFSNRTSIGWVPSTSTAARAVGVPTPAAPTLSATFGTLTPGKYGLVITNVDERGEESGACEVQIIDLPSGGGIRMSNLQQTSGWITYVYITSADGDVLRQAAEFPSIFANFAVGEDAQGGACDTQFLQPLIPGDFIRWHAGRLYTAKNGALSFSEPMRPHLYNPAHNVIPFSGHIAFVEPVVDGIYVGDSRGVWFLAGMDPTKFEIRHVSPCRAVVRSSVSVPPEHFDEKKVSTPYPVAVWLSTSGYVAGMAGGETVELQPERVKVPPGMTGRSAFLTREGRKQIVTPVNSSTTTAYGVATDSVI